MAGRNAELAGERRRARAAESRAYTAALAARRTATGVSPDRDLEGDVNASACEAEQAWHRCGEWVRKCDDAARVDRYADRFERREAARAAGRYATMAEQAADSAEEHARSADWAAKRVGGEDVTEAPPTAGGHRPPDHIPLYMRRR